ncbi:hypothetical protein DL93DRAFT_2227137 [Clavulina sp. PMI_390]|nr:hypothetical protein DL93DRAFT_2227137 [Clavulina sp. PMI_390]
MSVGYFIDAESPILSYHGAGWLPMLSTDTVYAPHYNNKTGMYTNITGDSMNISFFGTGIELYGPRLTNHGSFNVTLDGVITSGTTYSPTAEWATLFYSASNLVRGQHTFVITDLPRNANRSLLGVDYVIVQDSASPFPLTSSWESTPDTLSLGGSLSRTQSQVGSLEVRFTGSSIALYGRVGQSNAKYWCSIDGGANMSYNGFAAEMASQQTLFLANNLTGGGAEHVLRVWNEPNASNGHIWLEVDYIQVWGSNGLSAQRSSHADRTAGIIGGVVGGLLFILCSTLGFYLLRRRRQNPSFKMVTAYDGASTLSQTPIGPAPFAYNASTEGLPSFPPSLMTMTNPTTPSPAIGPSVEELRPTPDSQPPTYPFPTPHPQLDGIALTERNLIPVGQEDSPHIVSSSSSPSTGELQQVTHPSPARRAEDAGLLMTDRDLELRTLGRRTPGPGSPAPPNYTSAWVKPFKIPQIRRLDSQKVCPITLWINMSVFMS